MPWWNKKEEELPEALRGKTPEQIAEILNRDAAREAELTDLKTKNTELSSKFETFSADLDTRVAAGVSKALEGFTKPNNQQTPPNTELADFLTDPNKAFAQRAAPLAALTLSTAAVVAKDAARRKFQGQQRTNPGKNFDGYFFEKFENEVDEFAKTCSAEQLANPATWEHLYYNVKGRHADEIAAQLKEGKLDSVIESVLPNNRQPDKQDEGKLTDVELKIAARLGQTPEQYMKQKKAIVGDGGLGVRV